MDIIARNTKQLGAAIRRSRKKQSLTQDQLGTRMQARQATISKLEMGEPATQLRVLMDALTALNLELVLRPRSTASVDEVGNLF